MFSNIEKEIYEKLKLIYVAQKFNGSGDEKLGFLTFLEKTFNESNQTYFNLFTLHEKIVFCGIFGAPNSLMKLFLTVHNYDDLQTIQNSIKQAIQLNPNNFEFLTVSSIFLQYYFMNFLTKEIKLYEIYESNQTLLHKTTELEEQITKNNETTSLKNQEIEQKFDSKIKELHDTIEQIDEEYVTKNKDLENLINETKSELINNEPLWYKESDKKLLYGLKSYTNYIEEKDLIFICGVKPKCRNGIIQMFGDSEMFISNDRKREKISNFI